MSCSSAGSAPLSSAAARAAQLASVTWVLPRLSTLSFASPTSVVGGVAPAGGGGGGGATRVVMPSSLNGLQLRKRHSSTGSRRRAGARATTPASPMAVLPRWRVMSRDRAPRSKAAASADAPASPTCIPPKPSMVTAGNAPAPIPSASRCTPSGPADLLARTSVSSAGSTEPSVPSKARSAAVRPLLLSSTYFASRSSLQLRSPTLRHNAVAAS
eukprot:scaffold31252_cov63-Phaeocystis_antarctica.AAC.4